MLSFSLGGLDKPVIFTGSQIPLENRLSDAENNFLGALQLAAAGRVPEVGLYFNGKLLRGNCASKVSTSNLAAFTSHQQAPLADININAHYNDAAILPKERYFSHPLALQDGAISTLFLGPGLNWAGAMDLVTHSKTRGLILFSYGAGNIPANNPAFIELLKVAQQRELVVINKSQCIHGRISHDYAASKPLIEHQVVSALTMTAEACYCKLLYLLSKNKSPDWVRQTLHVNLRGEINTNI